MKVIGVDIYGNVSYYYISTEIYEARGDDKHALSVISLFQHQLKILRVNKQNPITCQRLHSFRGQIRKTFVNKLHLIIMYVYGNYSHVITLLYQLYSNELN